MMPMLAWLAVAALVSSNMASVTWAYAVGDYIPMARQGQFHSMRTHWHDAIGRHCPRFGFTREVVLPIPRPVGFDPNEDTYKLKLSFGRERYVTGWLPVLNHKMDAPPVVEIYFTHFGGELRGVNAKTVPLPSKYVAQHEIIMREFHNDTHWPKHIIVKYIWKEHAEVDVTAGLVLLFGITFALTTMLAIYVLQSSKDKLARFMSEHMAETVVAPGGVADAVPKVD